MKVDLWLAKLDELPDENEIFLSGAEKRRGRNFIYQKYRDHFIKRRSILRKLLSRFLGLSPSEIVIEQTDLGKPYVVNEREKVFFNTSHSKDHVLYGFSKDAEIGVDIEFLDAKIEAELISTHFFCPEEISLIRNAEEDSKPEAFFRLWCIKEAYIKLVGKGLTFPLDQVRVTDTMTTPRLAVPNQPAGALSCAYIDTIPGFGIGVVVEDQKLEIQYHFYRNE